MDVEEGGMGEGNDEETCSGITARSGQTTAVAEGKRRREGEEGEEEGEVEEEGEEEEEGSVDLCAGVAMEGQQEVGRRTLKSFTASFALHEASSSQDSPA